MYFDALTLAAVADELQATITGGRVQRVVLTNPLSIGLEVYARRQRHYLLASAHPQFARVHLLQEKPSRGVEQATPLLLLLRKYVLGGRIVSVEQPPLERILFLSIAKDPPSGNPPSEADDEPASEQAATNAEEVLTPLRCELIIEPMERRSNIILVDENNVILESIKRVTPRMSQRIILPQQPYEVPPPQDKRDPRTATAAGIRALRETGNPDLARALVAGYRGLSPQAAREIVYRALGQSAAALDDALPWESIARHTRELVARPWQPALAMEEGEPRAYAPYALTHLPSAQPWPDINAALQTFYAAREELTAHRQHRAAVRQQLDEARQQLAHQLERINAEAARTQDVEHLRWEGEMIFAFLHSLQPGQTTLEVEGRTIHLDPDKSAVENAQQRFRAYHKAHSGRESLQERQHSTALRLQGLEQLRALLEVADEREQIDQIAAEAREQGYIAAASKPGGKQQRATRRKPLRLVSSDGFTIYVGRSAEQNAEVTFRIGRPEDIWLHVRTIHGSHVIIRSGGSEVPEQTLHEAAGLAAYFSQAREESAVEVELARRKLVRKVPGGSPGLVTYRAERTLRVRPVPPWG